MVFNVGACILTIFFDFCKKNTIFKYISNLNIEKFNKLKKENNNL